MKILLICLKAILAVGLSAAFFAFNKSKNDMENLYERKENRHENDWKRKLTSRKLWTAVASFVSMFIVALGGAESEATQITALIMAGATVIAYIIGEWLT